MGDVKLKILRFKQAVEEGDFEKRRQTEAELREGFKNLGLDEELIKYLVAHIKRLAELEKAYEEKCRLLHEVRETIRELARKV
jgi:hypothetical protein